MTAYPRLPVFEHQRPNETAVSFGARALAFLLEHDGLTAVLEDNALEQAEHTAIYVVASKDITVIALDKINTIRLAIAVTLKCRLRDRAPAVAVGQQAPPQAPEGGRAARLKAPVPRRPSPSVAKPF